MKRFTILAVLLVLVGVSTGFAIELKPSVSLSGNESLTLGIDVTTGAIGFANATDATLQVNLVSDDSSDTHVGTGAIYGSITISNFDLYWVDGKENANNDSSGTAAVNAENPASVSATLFIPPFSIGLDSPGMSGDVVTEIEANSDFNDFSNIVLDSIVDNEDAADTVAKYPGPGMSVRYTDPGKMFWVQGDVKTALGYDGVDPDNQGVAFGLEASLTPSPVSVSIGAFYGFGYAGNPSSGMTGYIANPIVGYLSGVLTLEGIGVANLGVDVAFDPGAGVTNPFFGSFYFSAQMNFNKEATSFLIAKVLFDTVFNATILNHLDGYVDFEIPAGTLAGDLKVSVLAYFLDVISPDIEYAAKATLGYKVWSQGDMYILPQLTAAYGKPNALRVGTDAISAAIVAAPTDSIMAINPSVEIGLTANPLTTLTVGWSSGNLLRSSTPNYGTASMALKITY